MTSYEKADKYFATIREMIRHENGLVNQRLGWMFTLQGFLFTAASFLWKISPLPVIVLCFVGVLSCISIGYTLTRGLQAVKDLLDIAHKYYNKTLLQGMTFPPIIGSSSKALEWLLPAKLLPWVLGLAWMAILFFRVMFPVVIECAKNGR